MNYRLPSLYTRHADEANSRFMRCEETHPCDEPHEPRDEQADIREWLGEIREVAEYPADLLEERRAAFVRQIREYDAKSDGLWKRDPRTEAERSLDEFAKEVNDTRKSDYPY